jgi:hypothetical protein
MEPRRTLAEDAADAPAPPASSSSSASAAAPPAGKRRVLARFGPAAHNHDGGARFVEKIVPRLIDMRYATDIAGLVDVSPVFRIAPAPSDGIGRWDHDLLFRALLDARRDPPRGTWTPTLPWIEPPWADKHLLASAMLRSEAHRAADASPGAGADAGAGAGAENSSRESETISQLLVSMNEHRRNAAPASVSRQRRSFTKATAADAVRLYDARSALFGERLSVLADRKLRLSTAFAPEELQLVAPLEGAINELFCPHCKERPPVYRCGLRTCLRAWCRECNESEDEVELGGWWG